MEGGEIELDLAQFNLILDLERAFETKTWHFVRSAVLRVSQDKNSWTWRACQDVLRRRSN